MGVRIPSGGLANTGTGMLFFIAPLFAWAVVVVLGATILGYPWLWVLFGVGIGLTLFLRYYDGSKE